MGIDSSRGVVYLEPGKVEVMDIGDPEFVAPSRRVGIPGLCVADDPGGVDGNAKRGALSLRFGLGWAKAQSFRTMPCATIAN